MSFAENNAHAPAAEQSRKRARMESEAAAPSTRNNDLESASAAHIPSNGSLNRRQMVIDKISQLPSSKPSAWMVAAAEEDYCQTLWAQGWRAPISAEYFDYQVDGRIWFLFGMSSASVYFRWSGTHNLCAGDNHSLFPYEQPDINTKIYRQPSSLTYRWYCASQSHRNDHLSRMRTKDHAAILQSNLPSHSRRESLWRKHFAGLKAFEGCQLFEIPLVRFRQSGYNVHSDLRCMTKSLDNVIIHPVWRTPESEECALIWLKEDDGSRNLSQNEVLELKMAWNVMIKVVLRIKEGNPTRISHFFSSVMSEMQDDIDRSNLVTSALLGAVDDAETTAERLEGHLKKGEDERWHAITQQDVASGESTGGGVRGAVAMEEPVVEGDVKIVDEVVTRIISESRAPADSEALKAISLFALDNPQRLKLSCREILDQAVKTWKAKQATSGIVPKDALEILRY